MKIVHVITSLDDGGAQGVLYRLCAAMAGANCITVVSLMDESKYGPLLRLCGVEVLCLAMPRGRLTISGLFKLQQVLHMLKPDVVQTWMYHADLVGGLAARFAGVRRVFWGIRHSTFGRDKANRKTILTMHICALLSRFIPKWIVCCAHSALTVHKRLGYDASKLIVIPNGYDLNRFKPDPHSALGLRAEYGVSLDTALIGMVGRFHPQKDHENLICALGLLKRKGYCFLCALVGSGLDESNAALDELLQSNGVQQNVVLLGQCNDMPGLMNGLDIHVLSSAYGEAFPNVIAEAMACGTPCVATNVGDAPQIVGDTGWTVAPGNPHMLADALASAMAAWKDPVRWVERQAAARRRIMNNFDIKTMVESYELLWSGTQLDPKKSSVGAYSHSL